MDGLTVDSDLIFMARDQSGRLRMNREFRQAVAACALIVCLTPLLWAQDTAVKADTTANANEYTIPEGTEFKLQLHSALSSKTSKAGDRVMTALIDPVAVEDREVLAKGLRIDGHI